MRNDSPGGEGGVQASQHPEHAEPAQMFSTFIHLQELSEVGVHNWNGTSDSGAGNTFLFLGFLVEHICIVYHMHSDTVGIYVGMQIASVS